MKTTTLCLVVCAAITVLVVAVLMQTSKPKSKKDGFVANLVQEDWRVSLGVGVGIGIVSILILVFIIYLWNQPKKYNAANVPVGRRWAVPYNME